MEIAIEARKRFQKVRGGGPLPGAGSGGDRGQRVTASFVWTGKKHTRTAGSGSASTARSPRERDLHHAAGTGMCPSGALPPAAARGPHGLACPAGSMEREPQFTGRAD